MVQMMVVHELPPRDVFRIFVSSESLKGTCAPFAELSTSMTRCRDSSDLLMLDVSLTDEVTAATYVSEPAKSTKFSVEYLITLRADPSCRQSTPPLEAKGQTWAFWHVSMWMRKRL